jgi:hypothetical protein
MAAAPERFSQSLYAAAGLGLPLLRQSMDDMGAIVPAAARVSCEIRATQTEGGGKLDAVIMAAGSVSGTFQFTVRKRSGGDVISRSGDFKVESASPAEINKASVNLDSKEGYDASLEVKWPNGSSSCSSRVG